LRADLVPVVGRRGLVAARRISAVSSSCSSSFKDAIAPRSSSSVASGRLSSSTSRSAISSSMPWSDGFDPSPSPGPASLAAMPRARITTKHTVSGLMVSSGMTSSAALVALQRRPAIPVPQAGARPSPCPARSR
jgi:hypothetical protein